MLSLFTLLLCALCGWLLRAAWERYRGRRMFKQIMQEVERREAAESREARRAVEALDWPDRVG
jgi:predicted Rdx family selenoprotein